MVQSWDIFNLDKRRSLKHVSTLPEAIWNGGFENLRYHLSRGPLAIKDMPCKPFIVLSYDDEKPVDDPENSRKTWEIQYEDGYCYYAIEQQELSPRSTLGRLEFIPNEILHQIVQDIGDRTSIISFCLTNTIIYTIGYYVLQGQYLKTADDWAGDRLFGFGDCCHWTDVLASSLFISGDFRTLMRYYEPSKYITLGSFRSVMEAVEQRWSGPASFGSDLPMEWPHPNQIMDKFHLDDAMYPNVEQLLSRNFSWQPELDNSGSEKTSKRIEWVLCNLTKGVYVRANVIDDLGKEGLDWTIVLGTNICWSSDTSSDTNYEGDDLTRGRWTGDEFVFTSLDRIPGLGGREKWRDVTSWQVQRVQEIWESKVPEPSLDFIKPVLCNRDHMPKKLQETSLC
ncbi:hypothetical protein C8Q75DRAFT_803206 [Abortiporus biennis]|nr:hypothetical protein C8Q75DRAFT_803206 [Abortiporus biennis]